VPQEANQDTYLVLDDFGGRLGRAWRETDEEDTDRETLIRDLMEGQYSHPTRIVAFNTAEGCPLRANTGHSRTDKRLYEVLAVNG